MKHCVGRNRHIPLTIVNTCAFDSISNALLVSMMRDEESVTTIQEFSKISRFYKFIYEIYCQREVTVEAYFERAAMLQAMATYRNALTIVKRGKASKYACFDAESNAGGLAPFMLTDETPSLKFKTVACVNGHPSRSMPIKTMTFMVSRLAENPHSMVHIVRDVVEEFTSLQAAVYCNTAGCNAVTQRMLNETCTFNT